MLVGLFGSILYGITQNIKNKKDSVKIEVPANMNNKADAIDYNEFQPIK